MSEIPHINYRFVITSGPISVLYKGREIPYTEKLGLFLDGWNLAHKTEHENHLKKLNKLEEDLDKVLGIL